MGFFPVDHGDLEHPVFRVGGRQPYTRWEAYCWLLDHAAFDRLETAFQGKPVTLDRGQVATSLGEMATTWKWTRASVQRFIKGLISAGFITYSPANVASTGPDTPADTSSSVPVSMITLCRYSRIPVAIRVSDTAGDTPPDTQADTPAESTQYRDSYVKKERRKEKEGRIGGTPPASPPTFPAVPSGHQGDLLPTAEVVSMPPDDVQVAFDAYRAVAKELGLAVPMHRLEGKRRSSLRLRLKDLDGIAGWAMALDALRGAKFITSGGWDGFSIDDMVTPRVLERVMAGRYNRLWDRAGKPEHPVMREMREYYQDHHEESLLHDFDYNGRVRKK